MHPKRRPVLRIGPPNATWPRRRSVEKQSQVTGDSKPARVSQTVTVAKDEVGNDCKFPNRRQQHRYLAKSQQSRNIGEGKLPAGSSPLNFHQLREAIYDDTAPPDAASRIQSDVGSRHRANPPPSIYRHDRPAESLLQFTRFGGRRIPIAWFADLHRTSFRQPGKLSLTARPSIIVNFFKYSRKLGRPSKNLRLFEFDDGTLALALVA